MCIYKCVCCNFFIVYRLMLFFYSFSRNEDSDINRSKLLLNGFIGQATSNKYEDFTESFWGPRNNIENQTRQHYLARNRYITEQSLRLPYPSVYGTQNISEYFTISTCIYYCAVLLKKIFLLLINQNIVMQRLLPFTSEELIYFEYTLLK